MAQTSAEAEGYKTATEYILRQHWRLKWLTLFISGSMATYTVQSGKWIPFLEMGIVTWILIVIAMVLAQQRIGRLFVDNVKHMRQGNDHPLPMIMKAITNHTWIHWGIVMVAWYWVLTMVYMTFFMEIPAVP